MRSWAVQLQEAHARLGVDWSQGQRRVKRTHDGPWELRWGDAERPECARHDTGRWTLDAGLWALGFVARWRQRGYKRLRRVQPLGVCAKPQTTRRASIMDDSLGQIRRHADTLALVPPDSVQHGLFGRLAPHGNAETVPRGRC